MKSIKDQFPIFKRQINGKPLVFLDSAASAQKPQRVIDAMNDVMENHYANINRGVYTLSEEATEMVENSREKVAKFIGAEKNEIVFTRNATESINLVAYSWARHNLKKDDVIVLSEMEHHANIVPWQILRDEIGIELAWITVDDQGYLEWEKFKKKILRKAQNDNCDGDDRIKLICLTQVSNVLGTINRVKEIAEWAHSVGAKILVDGAQAVTNFSVNVKDLDCDWYVFSSHKLYGPTAVGVLYGKKDLLDSMPPFLSGGDMILEVTKEKTTFQEAPQKFEAGTPAIVEIVGFGAALDFINEIGFDFIREHNLELLKYTFENLSLIKSLKIFGPTNIQDRGGVVAFTMNGIHPHDIATILNEEGIAVRSGHHCAQPICDRFGVSAMVRVSFGVYNDISEIDKLFDGLLKVVEIFK